MSMIAQHSADGVWLVLVFWQERFVIAISHKLTFDLPPSVFPDELNWEYPVFLSHRQTVRGVTCAAGFAASVSSP